MEVESGSGGIGGISGKGGVNFCIKMGFWNIGNLFGVFYLLYVMVRWSVYCWFAGPVRFLILGLGALLSCPGGSWEWWWRHERCYGWWGWHEHGLSGHSRVRGIWSSAAGTKKGHVVLYFLHGVDQGCRFIG